MNPIAMTVIFVLTLGMFAWSAVRRYRLMMVGAPEPRVTFDPDSLYQRFRQVLLIAGLQRKMPMNERYRVAGIAHIAIFAGFNILLLNTILLWGRAYDVRFDLFGILAEDAILGQLYSFAKEVIAFATVVGAFVFVYYRLGPRPPRMTFGFEGLLILGIIITMMLSDFLYVGARGVLEARSMGEEYGFRWYEPVGSPLGIALAGLSGSTLTVLEHAGFWWHASWVLLFLNLLPYSKHFHIITSAFNVFFQVLEPRGKLRTSTTSKARSSATSRSASRRSRTSAGSTTSISTPAPSAVAAATTVRHTSQARSSPPNTSRSRSGIISMTSKIS